MNKINKNNFRAYLNITTSVIIVVLLTVGLIWIKGIAEATSGQPDPRIQEVMADLQLIQTAIKFCGSSGGEDITPHNVEIGNGNYQEVNTADQVATFGEGETMQRAEIPSPGQGATTEIGDIFLSGSGVETELVGARAIKDVGRCAQVATNNVAVINAAFGLNLNEGRARYYVNNMYPDSAGFAQAFIPASGEYRASWLAIRENGLPYCRAGECRGEGSPLDEVASFASTGGQVLSSMVIADFDGDSDLEVTVGSLDDYKIWGWNHLGNQLFDLTLDGMVYSSPAVANIDTSNPNLEIAVGGGTYLYVLNPNAGNPPPILHQLAVELNQTTPAGIVNSSPAVVDLDGDGNLDMLTGVDTNFREDGQLGAIYAWHQNGTSFIPPVDNAPGLFARVAMTVDMISAAIGDLVVGDGPGKQIIMGDQAGNLYAWNGNGTAYAPFGTHQIIGGITSSCSPALADINGDGNLEILVGGNDNHLYSFYYNGTDVTADWTYDMGTDIKSPPVIADIADYPEDEARNKDLEIVFLDDLNGLVHILHHDGTPVQAVPLVDIGDSGYTSPAIADVNNDGYMDIVVASYDGAIHVLRGPNGAHDVLDLGLPVDQHILNSSPALVANLDADADLEILLGTTGNQIYRVDLEYGQAGEILWGKYRHDLNNTGLYDRGDRQVPLIVGFTPPGQVFQPGQTISFTVTASDNNTIEYIKVYRDNGEMPAGLTFNHISGETTAEFNWTPAGNQVGYYEFSIVATDAYGLHSLPATFTIEVEGTIPLYNSGNNLVGYYSTIQDAINAAVDPLGNRIEVPSGTYLEHIIFTSYPITLQGMGGPAGTIITGGGTGRVVSFPDIADAGSSLRGFTITSGANILGGEIYCLNANQVVIENTIITGGTRTGRMFVQGGSVTVQGACSIGQ